jgi:hypothetical protein
LESPLCVFIFGMSCSSISSPRLAVQQDRKFKGAGVQRRQNK